MNLLYALIYLIQLAIYVCLLILFRVYLFLIFLTKDGARWVSAILLTEPRRVCRRLQLLSRMEHHEQDHEQVFP